MREPVGFILVGEHAEEMERVEMEKIISARYLPHALSFPFSPEMMEEGYPLPEKKLAVVLGELADLKTIQEPFGMFMASGLLQFEIAEDDEPKWLPPYMVTAGGRVLSILGGNTSLCYVLSRKATASLKPFFKRSLKKRNTMYST